MTTATIEPIALVDHPKVVEADERVAEARRAREAAIARVKAAQAQTEAARLGPGTRISADDHAAVEAALDELGAAYEERASAEAELRAALRDRDATARRSLAAVLATWRPAHHQAIADAEEAVSVALGALQCVAEVERAAERALSHPSVRLSRVPRLEPSVSDALDALTDWLDASRS